MEDHTERRYLVSIDGGGTKTGICVYDCVRKDRRSDVCGGGNYKTHGIGTVFGRIHDCLKGLLPETDDVPSAVCFLVMGLSGCDSPRDFEIYAEMMRKMGFLDERMLICNDSELIFRALTDAPGICAVAGTGTIALAFGRDGSVFRAGGWGAPISDEGSGYWIGAEMIRAYLDRIDGIGSGNEFFRIFPEKLGCSSNEEAAALLAVQTTPEVAEWAKTVCGMAEENDLCHEIVRRAAEKTAILAASACRKASFGPDEELSIVESGGLFRNALYEGVFRNALINCLPAGYYRFLRPEGTPAEEGIRLAMKMADKMATTQSGD